MLVWKITYRKSNMFSRFPFNSSFKASNTSGTVSIKIQTTPAMSH